MSFVTTHPEIMMAASLDLQGIGSMMAAGNAAVASPTTGVQIVSTSRAPLIKEEDDDQLQLGDVDAHGATIRAQVMALEAEHQAIVRDVLAAGDFWGGAGSVSCQEFITELGRNFQVIYESANAHGSKVADRRCQHGRHRHRRRIQLGLTTYAPHGNEHLGKERGPSPHKPRATTHNINQRQHQPTNQRLEKPMNRKSGTAIGLGMAALAAAAVAAAPAALAQNTSTPADTTTASVSVSPSSDSSGNTITGNDLTKTLSGDISGGEQSFANAINTVGTALGSFDIPITQSLPQEGTNTPPADTTTESFSVFSVSDFTNSVTISPSSIDANISDFFYHDVSGSMQGLP